MRCWCSYQPLQIVDDGSDTTDLFHQQGLSGDLVGKHIPVPGGCRSISADSAARSRSAKSGWSVADLGMPEEIGKVFAGFQQNLYPGAA